MGEQKSIPVVTFFDFLKNALKIVKNPLPFHHRNFEKHGDTFVLKLGFREKILFSRNAAFLRYVLQKNQKNYTKSKVQTKDVARYMGKGLLTSEGEHWKKQRKLIQPTFHKKKLEQLLGIMQRTISDELSTLPVDKETDLVPFFGRLAFQVVAKSLFSGEVDDKTIERLQHIVEAAQKMLVRELRQPYLSWWFRASGILKEHDTMIKEARELIRRLIEGRKESADHKNDLLDLLLGARYDDGSSMDEEQMIDEIMILFTAGHETTSNALTFTCQLLARHPDYQEQIRLENSALTSLDPMEKLMRQQITKQVLEESMRLYPPAYFIDRMNLEIDTFQDMAIPKGMSLLFSVIEIHRHESLWESPMQFMPERFNQPTNRYSDCYFPFGAGPRMCIGNNFAMFEMQLVLDQLMEHFKILPSKKPIEVLPLITLKPKNARLTLKRQ